MHNNSRRGALGIGVLVFIAFALIIATTIYFSHKQALRNEARKANEAPLTINSTSQDFSKTVSNEAPSMVSETSAENSATGTPTKTSSAPLYKGTVLAGTISPLLEFNSKDYEVAKSTNALIVLYFYATWCPICKHENTSALVPFFETLRNPNVVGFRVHFNDTDTGDTERELAKEFGVVYQHTKVFVKNGVRILKSPEAWDIARYEKEVAAAIGK